MRDKWNPKDIEDLDGKTVIVTGANSGLGFESAKVFAEKDAKVIMACRNMEKGENARKKIEEEVAEASLNVMELNLASMDSIDNFVQEFNSSYDELHILCNNAGVMAIPRQETEDGFEKQLGVNHLGHFKLTAGLYDLLEETDGETRIVNQSSAIHENGEINFEDLMMEKNYDKWQAYAQSKLANVLFTYELDRRVGSNVKAVACHPGYAATDLQYRGPQQEGSKIKYYFMKMMNLVLAQSAEKGALPMIYGATSENIEGGEYIGPNGFKNMRGYPEKQESSHESYDEETAERLWEKSEELTKTEFKI